MTFSFRHPSATSLSPTFILLTSTLDPDLERVSLPGVSGRGLAAAANGCLGIGTRPANADAAWNEYGDDDLNPPNSDALAPKYGDRSVAMDPDPDPDNAGEVIQVIDADVSENESVGENPNPSNILPSPAAGIWGNPHDLRLLSEVNDAGRRPEPRRECVGRDGGRLGALVLCFELDRRRRLNRPAPAPPLAPAPAPWLSLPSVA